jgi:hypothetical protein
MSPRSEKEIQMCNLFAKFEGLIIIFFLIVVPGCRSAGEGAPPTFPDAKTAAEQSLGTFRELITKDNYYKDLGFDSVKEAAGAQLDLGAPLAIFLVRLDRLRDYQPGSDANSLLSDSTRMYYPVLVKTQPRAAIIVEKADGKWRVASMGSAGLAKQISNVQQKTGTPSASVSEPDMIVQVPALGIYFIGRRGADKKLMLIPLATDLRYKLEGAVEQPADGVFSRLAPFAKSHKGLPM